MNFSKSSVYINGNSYIGNNITVVGNKVFIDGKDQTPNAKEIEIVVHSNIDKLEVDYANNISINGEVNSVESRNGDIDIKGNVGSIVTNSGDVTCGNVTGSVITNSGDICRR